MVVTKLLNSIFDKLSEKVQDFTGEAKRRELVDQFKEVYGNYRWDICELIKKINLAINRFNERIEKLNEYRANIVKKDIFYLGVFLNQFGSLKKSQNFAIEEKQEQVELPQKHFEQIEDYIGDIDWSKDEVFNKSFTKGIWGTRSETRKLNLQTTGDLNRFIFEGNRANEVAKSKVNFIEQDIKILDLYQESVQTISETIEEKIIPEIELVKAFLQCDKIKNQILANQEVAVTNENDISLIAGTMYNKHYKFIKNSFLFFIISSKIYNTPVLTNLLNNEEHGDEGKTVIKYGEILTEQKQKLNAYIVK